MTMEAAGMQSEIRIVDGAAYMNMGALTQNKFFDLAEMGGGAADVTALLDQVNPEAQMAVFETAIEDFSAEPDAEKIDGVSTTKVTLTLNTKRLMAATPQLAEQDASVLESLGETMQYVMFVGSDDLPRRIVAPGLGDATTTINYSAWGEPVSVSAPNADELADASAFGH